MPTNITPEVILDPKGIITIKGRFQVLNTTNIPAQVASWINDYLHNPAESTEVNIAFEYLNSYGIKIITFTLQEISKVIQQNKKLVIHWYYEDDDEDILRRGENVSSALHLPIEFIMTNSQRDG